MAARARKKMYFRQKKLVLKNKRKKWIINIISSMNHSVHACLYKRTYEEPNKKSCSSLVREKRFHISLLPLRLHYCHFHIKRTPNIPLKTFQPLFLRFSFVIK